MSNSKFSMASISSTCAGDSSSESLHSLEDDVSLDEEMHSTLALDRSDMPSTRESSPEPFHLLDRSDMPSTREPSPEPYWNNANLYKWNDPSVESLWRAHRGLNNDHVPQHNLRRRSSCEPVVMQHEDVNPPAQRVQTVLLVP